MKFGRTSLILLLGAFLVFTPATSQARLGILGRIVTAPFRLVRAIRRGPRCRRGRCGQRVRARGGCSNGRCGNPNQGNFQDELGDDLDGNLGGAPAPGMAGTAPPMGGGASVTPTVAAPPPGDSPQPTTTDASASAADLDLVDAHAVKPDTARDKLAVEGLWKPLLDVNGSPWESKQLIVNKDGLIAIRDRDGILRKVWQDKQTGTLYVPTSQGNGRPLTIEYDKCFLHELGWYYLNRKEDKDPVAAKFLERYFHITPKETPAEALRQLPAPAENEGLSHVQPAPDNVEKKQRPIDDSPKPKVVDVTSEQEIPQEAKQSFCSTDGTCTYVGPDGTQYRLTKPKEEKPVEKSPTPQPTPQPAPKPTQSVFGSNFQNDADYNRIVNQVGKEGRIVMLTLGSPADGFGFDCPACDQLHRVLRTQIAATNRDLAIFETDIAKPQGSSQIAKLIREGSSYPRIYLMKFSPQQNKWVAGQNFTNGSPSAAQLQQAIANLRAQP